MQACQVLPKHNVKTFSLRTTSRGWGPVGNLSRDEGGCHPRSPSRIRGQSAGTEGLFSGIWLFSQPDLLILTEIFASWNLWP